MRKVLVTGMSGTGKSAVLARLRQRGHRVVDTDHGDWAEEIVSAESVPEQVWREDRMAALLAEQGSGYLFVAGCVANQGRFYDLFDVVVLLTAPVDLLLERIATRTTNPFGKDPAERQRILDDLREVEPLLRATAAVEIITNRSIDDVVDAVEVAAERPQRRATALAGNSRTATGVPDTMTDLIPEDYAHLLEQPLYGHLGTIRPDDTVQVNPMWFEYDGERLRFTHTVTRAKYRNLQHNPSMSLSIIDPDNQFRYLELRGKLVDVETDPTGAFYVRLGQRYGNAEQQPPPDSADRVVLVMSIEKTTKQ